MKTERIKLGVAVIVMPFREPVVLAKQAITLDHFSNGRLLLGIGLGDSRAEFVSIKPREAKAHRGRMLDEGLEAVSRLLSEPESSYDGENYAHDGVIFFPRPVQDPLPIYIAGHSPTTPQRIARHAHGWLVSYPSLESFKADRLVVEEAMHAQGRTMSELDITTTWGMRLDRTREKALSNYKNSVQERLKTSGPLERPRRLVHGRTTSSAPPKTSRNSSSRSGTPVRRTGSRCTSPPTRSRSCGISSSSSPRR